MNQHETTTPTERKPFGRRTVLKGAAWSVPAVVAVGATPAFAATGGGALAFSDQPAYIYSGNVTAVTFLGTSPAVNQEQTITVSSGTATGSVTILANQTTWSVSVNASSLADGQNLTFTAASSLAPLVSSATTTITKDVAPPNLTLTTNTGNKQTGTLGGALGTATTPTADILTVSASATPTSTFTYAITYPTATTWQVVWTWTGRGNGGGNTITVAQSDVAGNTATVTHLI